MKNLPSHFNSIIKNLVLEPYIVTNINYVNERVPIGPNMFLGNSDTKFGRHTLALINDNFILDISSNPDAPFNNLRPTQY